MPTPLPLPVSFWLDTISGTYVIPIGVLSRLLWYRPDIATAFLPLPICLRPYMDCSAYVIPIGVLSPLRPWRFSTTPMPGRHYLILIHLRANPQGSKARLILKGKVATAD